MTNQEYRTITAIPGVKENEIGMILAMFRIEGLVEDIKAGMDEFSLVSKYKISSASINKVFQNVVTKGGLIKTSFTNLLSACRSQSGVAIIDIETNVNGDGTDESPTEPYWIGGVLVRKMKIVSEFEEFVSVSRPLTKFSMDLTGMTQERLDRNSIGLKEALEKLMKWKKNVRVFSSWSPYDFYILRKRSEECGVDFAFDSFIDAKAPFPNAITKSHLDTVLEYFGGFVANHHSALSDAKMTFKVIELVEKAALNKGLWRRVKSEQ